GSFTGGRGKEEVKDEGGEDLEFDDCTGNEDVKFEVSDPNFHVNEDLNLVPQRDVLYSRPILFIHGLSAHADDVAQVDVTGLPVQPPHTLKLPDYIFARGSNFLKPPLGDTQPREASAPSQGRI
ncbi:hypothetical protein KUCAC02_021460, partial [Chaenocephalus aceratus]